MCNKSVPIGALIILAMSMFVSVARAQSTDAWVGTWKLNVAKSQFAIGRAAPRSWTFTIASPQGDWSSVADAITQDGKTVHEEVEAKFDGNDYPMKEPAGMTLSLTRVDDHNVKMKFVDERASIQILVVSVVSQDGKTMTQTVTAYRSGAVLGVNVQVWDKQIE
jgi:hypothetical protein